MFIANFYSDTRNEDFSKVTQKKALSLDVPFEQNLSILGDTLNGELNQFKRSLAGSLTRAKSLQDGRNAEGVVRINGRKIPGIFQGFEINGGLNLEKFDKDKMKIKPIKTDEMKEATAGGKLLQVYQVNRGMKPISGRADFILLDDRHSTAVQKAKEFIRIVTSWEGGEAAEDMKKILGSTTPIEKVFKIRSLLVGRGQPFDFSYVMIPDYKLNMGTGLEGQIGASFNFEQFSLFTTEATPETPKTKQTGAGNGKEKAPIEEPVNPVLTPITITP